LLLIAMLGLTCVSSCEWPDESTRPAQDVAGRALGYLETTDDELGLDVVVAVQVYGELTGDTRAGEVAARLEKRLRPKDVARYGVLLELPKPRLPPGSLHAAQPSPTVPDPGAALEEDWAQRCPSNVLRCQVDEACRAFVELNDQWGYVLTHQALWLVFAHWVSCETGVDVEERRRTLGASLLKATRTDPHPSELMMERLAMLGHLGFAAEITPAWIDTIVQAQRPEGCFPVDLEGPCHPHPTGVALWALAHAERGNLSP
jgi:hypothetical protein